MKIPIMFMIIEPIKKLKFMYDGELVESYIKLIKNWPHAALVEDLETGQQFYLGIQPND